jgi:beta-glucosidase
VINCDKHRGLALEAARKSIVLLKNDNNILPLDDKPKRISLIGPGAANMHTLLGNYFGLSSRLVTILEGLAEKTRTKYGISMSYTQACLQYEANHPSNVEFGLATPPDVFIAVVGLDGAMEGEEGDAIASSSNGDREYIELPPWQLAILRQVKANGKPVILVLTGGSPIAIPDDIDDAVLFAWYPGEEGGTAVADIIFGDTVPSGKLPLTFPAATTQLPPYENYDMKGRTYRYMTEKPLYPFGFGLSYTSFAFDALTLGTGEISAGGELSVKVNVSNTGSRDAETVVQVYVSGDDRGADDPVASLRAFRRVAVPGGASVAVDFALPASAFETVDARGKSTLVPGSYTVHVAEAAPVPVAVEKGATRPVAAKVVVR